MSRGAFFLAMLLLIMGITFLISALRGRGPQMLAALQQIGNTQAKKEISHE